MLFRIHFPHNVRCDWLKKRASRENGCMVYLNFEFLLGILSSWRKLTDSDKHNENELFVCSEHSYMEATINNRSIKTALK